MPAFCSNCGAPLAGPFCAACGHRAGSPDRADFARAGADHAAQSIPQPMQSAPAQPTTAAAPQPTSATASQPAPVAAAPQFAAAPQSAPPTPPVSTKKLLIIGGVVLVLGLAAYGAMFY